LPGGISGTSGRYKRPGLDAILKGVSTARIRCRGGMVGVPVWPAVGLIGLLGERRSRDIDLYLHQKVLGYLDAIRQDAIRDVVGVLRVREAMKSATG
jgi:hypothetical protein